MERSNMDSAQDTTDQPGTEEKPKAVTTPPSTAATEKPAKSAKAAVGSSAGARTKTVESEKPADPVNKIRRGIIWSLVGGFLATDFLMFLRFFLPRTLFDPST